MISTTKVYMWHELVQVYFIAEGASQSPCTSINATQLKRTSTTHSPQCDMKRKQTLTLRTYAMIPGIGEDAIEKKCASFKTKALKQFAC